MILPTSPPNNKEGQLEELMCCVIIVCQSLDSMSLGDFNKCLCRCVEFTSREPLKYQTNQAHDMGRDYIRPSETNVMVVVRFH